MEGSTIFALFKSKIDNQTPHGNQKRPSAVKKVREGCHGRLVCAAAIIKGRRPSKKAVGCLKRPSAV